MTLMYRQMAIFALSAFLATATFAAFPGAALADEIDDYYEDEYAEDSEETTEDPDEVSEEVIESLKYARTGMYAHFGIAQIFEDLSPAHMAKNDVGVNFRVGWRFRHHFALEFDYQTIPNWELTFPTGNAARPTTTEEIDIHSLTLNAKAFFLTGRIQPFVQLGLGLAIASAAGSDSDSTFEGRFGVGLAFYATENVVLSLTGVYTRAFGDLDIKVGSGNSVVGTLKDIKYTSLIWGVGYHF